MVNERFEVIKLIKLEKLNFDALAVQDNFLYCVGTSITVLAIDDDFSEFKFIYLGFQAISILPL